MSMNDPESSCDTRFQSMYFTSPLTRTTSRGSATFPEKKSQVSKIKGRSKKVKMCQISLPHLDTSTSDSVVSLTVGSKRHRDEFYNVSCEQLANKLLGEVLVRRLEDGTVLRGRIVETECYLGGEDRASHSYRGKVTERNKPMYMKPGTAYVYFTYGMYHCFNISSMEPGGCVLLRAVEPLQGTDYMLSEREKRKKAPKDIVLDLTMSSCSALSNQKKNKSLKIHELCNGPAKLCISFNISKQSSNTRDLCSWEGMWIEPDQNDRVGPHNVVSCPRIGIDSAGFEWASKPLRFYIVGNLSVSRRDKLSGNVYYGSVCVLSNYLYMRK
ncbi:unnamed protein product [Timema podura]|uniref:DNA-3-methyladenine glycosylase II n=1 Tax=Timema podura TaxID=61482 RepID=A0ABN7NQF7_TIMPD|nr:unnamed protein product [Timema podura]